MLARSCIIKAPDIAPVFPSPDAEAKTAEDSSDDKDDDDDDDDDDSPGLILPGSATCLAISGTLTAGLQFDSYRVPRGGSQVPPDGFTWLPSASFRIETAHDLASGLRLGTAFEMSVATNPGQPDSVTLDEATVTLGTVTFGLTDSRFNFWTGDEFAFSARLPARNATLIAWERDLTDRWNLALSLEEPSAGTTASLPAPASRVPDGVARITYTNGPLTVHLAGALREVAGRPARLGRAGILGATYELNVLGAAGEVTAQIAGAIDAAPYIGSSLDAAVVRQVLLPQDSTRGFSAVLAARREWSEHWASNVYVSRYLITLPLPAQAKGKLRIDRLAANLVWTPLDGFKAGFEATLAWGRAEIASRTLPATLGGRQISGQLFLERTF
ncbi:porin [Bosea sp. Root381]|uniref:porin n=1 Tax=Bosea sp. Root381 TaxID=1736524 RepID=UPI0012E3E73F|nr:porin [Bosea sp. Root381]